MLFNPYRYAFSSVWSSNASMRRLLPGNSDCPYLQDSTLNIRKLDGRLDKLVTLNILGSVSNSVIQQCMAANLNVNIILDPRKSSFLGLQETLVSGDNSIDMYLVTSNGIYTEVIDKGEQFFVTPY